MAKPSETNSLWAAYSEKHWPQTLLHQKQPKSHWPVPTRHAGKSGEHSEPKCHFFLPSSAAYFFPQTIPPLSHPLNPIFVALPTFLVLHARISKLTTDFRGSCPSLSSSTCSYIWFYFPPLVCSSTEQAQGLSVIIDVFCAAHSIWVRVHFNSIEVVNIKCNSDNDAAADTFNVRLFYTADVWSDHWLKDFHFLKAVVNWLNVCPHTRTQTHKEVAFYTILHHCSGPCLCIIHPFNMLNPQWPYFSLNYFTFQSQ